MAKSEVAIPTNLKAISTFEEAMKYAVSNGEITNVIDLGDGFSVMKADDKRRLVGVELIVVEINFGQDEVSKREYVVLKLVTRNGSKLIMTDGSTGVLQQIRDAIEANNGVVPNAIYAPKGLVASDYIYTNPTTGEQGEATTFYFDLSGADTGKQY